MKKSLNLKKGNVKAVLFVVGIVLIVSGLFYSQKLVLTLKATGYRLCSLSD